MFKKFKELFGSENLLDLAFDKTVTMMEFDYKMYKASKETLRDSDSDELPFDFKKTDRKINKYEREVRRNVLTHLSVAGTQNIVPGLVLVSIVIDVERIGDYTKNIAGLAKMNPRKLHGDQIEDKLQKIESYIDEHFPIVTNVLRSQDKKKARQVMEKEEEISKIVDSMIKELVTNKTMDISCSEAVILAMYIRFLKRINAHLTNIASAIVNPFPRIGFREK